MNAPRPTPAGRARRLAAARIAATAAAAAVTAGCGPEIGDSCSRNIDCEQDGTRICDRTQPGGYCTIEGCDRGTCPGEAVCVAFFAVEFSPPPCGVPADCAEDDGRFCCGEGRALGGGCCEPDAICLSDGLCAPRSSERRFCMRGCGDDGDCRGDYRCLPTGLFGAELAQDVEGFDPEAEAGYCAPEP